MFSMWRPTVLGEMKSRSPTCRLVRPKLINLSTSISRSDRPAGRVCLGDISLWPAAASTASTATWASLPAFASAPSDRAASSGVSLGRHGRSDVIALKASAAARICAAVEI